MARHGEEHDLNAESKARPAGGRRWTRWLTLAIGLLLLAWVLSQVSLAQLAGVLRRADAGMLAAALAMGMLATALRCARYALFFPVRSRWRELYGAFAMMRLLNLVMPLRTGEVASLGLLKSHRLAPSIAETLPVWLVLRLTDVVALAFWLVPASLFFAAPDVLRRARWIVPLAIVAAVFAVAVTGVAARAGLRGRGSWLGGRMDAFRQGWERLRGPGRLVRVLLLGIAIAATMIGINACGQLAFASPLPWTLCWLLSAVVLAVTMLPVHGPLGLGTLEVSWVALMSLYDVPVPEAVGIALGIRLLSLAIILVDGALGLALLSYPALDRDRAARS